MVLDYKKFNPPSFKSVQNYQNLDKSEILLEGLLYVGEQIPGSFEAMDVTKVLITKGYWASYNIPYF